MKQILGPFKPFIADKGGSQTRLKPGIVRHFIYYIMENPFLMFGGAHKKISFNLFLQVISEKLEAQELKNLRFSFAEGSVPGPPTPDTPVNGRTSPLSITV